MFLEVSRGRGKGKGEAAWKELQLEHPMAGADYQSCREDPGAEQAGTEVRLGNEAGHWGQLKVGL